MRFHTWTSCLVSRQMICSKPIYIFPCGHFVLILHYCKAHTLTDSCTLVALCIVGQLHNNGSEEVKCLVDIWADEQVCQMLDTTHKNSEVYKIVNERMKERGYERSVNSAAQRPKLRQQYMRVRDQLAKGGGSTNEVDKINLV